MSTHAHTPQPSPSQPRPLLPQEAHAATPLAIPETLRDDTGHRRRPVECRWLDESRAEAVRLIGAEAVADALAEGRAMPLEAAVGNALDVCHSIAQPAASPR
jgi:hypothetical protein